MRMPNIVSNCCLGGHLYRTQGWFYNNPFMWCAILHPSIMNLITKWDDIDFTKFHLVTGDWSKCADKRYFKLIIDNMVEVHYTHYLKDERYATPHIDDVDVNCADVENYIIEKYTERLSRMNERPVFVVLDEMPYYDYTHDNVKALLELPTNYKIVCITRHQDLLDYNSNNRLCIFDDTNRLDDCHCPIYYTKYTNEINSFIMD